MIDLGTFLIWLILVIGGYHSMEYMLPLLTERFEQLNKSRRRYVIKNLLKSGLLLILAVITTKPMMEFMLNSKPDNMFIHTVGFMYALPDVYALWWMANTGLLASTTVCHHVFVALLATIGLFQDYTSETHWVAMLIYAYMSMWTGVVNFYIGVRFLLYRNNKTEDNIRRVLAIFSLGVYVLACTLNWAYQIHTVVLWLDFRWTRLSWTAFCGLIVYCCILTGIIRDDIFLLKKLVSECKPYVPPATQEECVKHFLFETSLGRGELSANTLTGSIHSENQCNLENDGDIVPHQAQYWDINQLCNIISSHHTPYKLKVKVTRFRVRQ